MNRRGESGGSGGCIGRNLGRQDSYRELIEGGLFFFPLSMSFSFFKLGEI